MQMASVEGLCVKILKVSLKKVFPFCNFAAQIVAIPCKDGKIPWDLIINNNDINALQASSLYHSVPGFCKYRSFVRSH